nr:hypothetical protein CFP56_13240 [Quercus suber]
MAQPTFVPYTKPNQKIKEFIALGGSYTAGTGCNGLDKIIAADAVRGKRSYPMQMSDDLDNWGSINGGENTLPRFSFHAYTGDTTVELVTEQLKKGDHRDDRNLPRNQPFGKPQIALLTIGGNDVMLAWLPKNCQETFSSLQSDIDSGVLRGKINYALYSIADAGRAAGGLNRPESFQLGTWPWQTEPKLTTTLRNQLNTLTNNVNNEIRRAAQDLERMGVIFVEGFEDLYTGHRFCEPDYTDQQMVDYETDPAQVILDFVFPGQDYNVSATSADSPPWGWDGAEQYPSLDDLLTAMMVDGAGDTVLVPFNYRRSFHPKGTAYGAHATQLFARFSPGELRRIRPWRKTCLHLRHFILFCLLAKQHNPRLSLDFAHSRQRLYFLLVQIRNKVIHLWSRERSCARDYGSLVK